MGSMKTMNLVKSNWGVVASLVALGALTFAPFIFLPFRVYQFATVLTLSILLIGLTTLIGKAGQVSFGHVFFFALGIYGGAILTERLGLPHFVSLLVVILVGYVVGLLVGAPALRLKGLYLGLVTLALSVATAPLIRYFGSVTGGSRGMAVTAPRVPDFLPLAQDQWIFYLVLVIFVLTVGTVWQVSRSDFGRAMLIVKGNEFAAQMVGINVGRLKTKVFALSAALAAAAGVLSNWIVRFATPDALPYTVSIMYVAAVVVGGLGSLLGAVIGGVVLVFLPIWSDGFRSDMPGVIFGAVIILTMIFSPAGIMGSISRLSRRIKRRFAKDASSVEDNTPALK